MQKIRKCSSQGIYKTVTIASGSFYDNVKAIFNTDWCHLEIAAADLSWNLYMVIIFCILNKITNEKHS